MRRRTAWVALGVLTLALAVFVGGAAGNPAAGKPIVIGAAVDLTKGMAPFDAPALGAAQVEIARINAKGGVNGRPLQLKFINDQLDPNKTKQAAATLLGQGVDIGWGACDVLFAHPPAQPLLPRGHVNDS